jgi:hypothetical protein
MQGMVKAKVTLETLLKEAGLEESEKHWIGEDGSLEQGTPPVEPSDADRAEAAARAAAEEARKLEHPLGVAESALALARARVLQSLPTPQAAAQLEQSMPYSGELADPTKVFYAARTLSSAAHRELFKDNDDQPPGTTDRLHELSNRALAAITSSVAFPDADAPAATEHAHMHHALPFEQLAGAMEARLGPSASCGRCALAVALARTVHRNGRNEMCCGNAELPEVLLRLYGSHSDTLYAVSGNLDATEAARRLITGEHSRVAPSEPPSARASHAHQSSFWNLEQCAQSTTTYHAHTSTSAAATTETVAHLPANDEHDLHMSGNDINVNIDDDSRASPTQQPEEERRRDNLIALACEWHPDALAKSVEELLRCHFHFLQLPAKEEPANNACPACLCGPSTSETYPASVDEEEKLMVRPLEDGSSSGPIVELLTSEKNIEVSRVVAKASSAKLTAELSPRRDSSSLQTADITLRAADRQMLVCFLLAMNYAFHASEHGASECPRSARSSAFEQHVLLTLT